MAFTWQGEWSDNGVYSKQDMVSASGSLFICSADNAGVDPSTDDGTYWRPKAGDPPNVILATLVGSNDIPSGTGTVLLNLHEDAILTFPVPADGDILTILSIQEGTYKVTFTAPAGTGFNNNPDLTRYYWNIGEYVTGSNVRLRGGDGVWYFAF